LTLVLLIDLYTSLNLLHNNQTNNTAVTPSYWQSSWLIGPVPLRRTQAKPYSPATAD